MLPLFVFGQQNTNCQVTTPDILGPYFLEGAPITESIVSETYVGDLLFISGVLTNDCETPIANAVIDFWQTDENGSYDYDGYSYRGKILTNTQGSYNLETIIPGKYLNGSDYRPAHIHLKVAVDGVDELVTQIYFEGDTDIPADNWASSPAAVNRIIPLSAGFAGDWFGTFDIAVSIENYSGAIVFGCTNSLASNFNDQATQDDDSCEWLDCNQTISNSPFSSFIDDSICHENLYCEDFDWDGGDCWFDCNDSLINMSDVDAYLYNNQCDSAFNCSFFNFDNESCTELEGCQDENGTSYQEGAQWNVDACTACFCEQSAIVCSSMSCLEPECSNPVYLQDECCPVCPQAPLCEQIFITLANGWNMIGFSCEENTDAIDAFFPIQSKIIIAKDGAGNAYLPNYNFNGIGDLERGYGYLIKVSEQVLNYNICN